MPVLFRYKGFRFLLYSNEGNPREPIHIHVVKDGIDAKFWLDPVRLAYNDGFNAQVLRELKEHGMSSSLIKAVNVRFDENSMTIALSDGRALGVPLAWFPRLLHASQAQRMQYRISTRGLHWEALDEDISLAGLLAGYGDMTRRPAQAA